MFSVSAQEPLSYSYVIQKDSATAVQIYDALMDFIATEFVATDGDFYHDKDALVITKDVRVNFSPNVFTRVYDGDIRYKIKFQCRDGRFKMELTNFCHRSYGTSKEPGDRYTFGLIGKRFVDLNNMTPKSYNEKVWNQITERCAAEAEGMRRRMDKLNVTPDRRNDW